MNDRSMIDELSLAAQLMRERVNAEKLRAVLAPRMWDAFVSELRAGSVTVVRDDLPLVEGRDFIVDFRRGIVTLTAEAFNGETLDVEKAVPLAMTGEIDMRATALPGWIEPRRYEPRREAQWKTERRGRRL